MLVLILSVAGATQTNVSGSTYTFTKTYNYADYTYGSHTHTPTLTVSDAAGNTSTNNTITVNISKSDDQNPSITSFSADDTSVDLKTSAKTQTVLFTAVVSDNVGINSISVSGATQSSVSGGTYVFSKTYSYSSYSYGSSTDVVTLTVSDAAGNSLLIVLLLILLHMTMKFLLFQISPQVIIVFHLLLVTTLRQ